MSRLLVDTHTLLWAVQNDPRLSAGAREALDAAQQPLLSAVSLIEIGVKRSIRKLSLPDDWQSRARAQGLELLPMTWAHAERLETLAFVTVAGNVHRDPFDRVLVAQALTEGTPIVTRDPAIAAHGVQTIW